MNNQEIINYCRIAKAIKYIQANFKQQPSLEEIAQHVHLSPFHFQRLFQEWAGTSPKKFLQYISTQYAKELLASRNTSISDATFETGLSSNSRLHDLFIKIEGMTPAEYKDGGKNILIDYAFYSSPFGELLIASTNKGICNISFIDDRSIAVKDLINQYPNAKFTNQKKEIHQAALKLFQPQLENLTVIKLHLKGTDFQLKVWEALLKIPFAHLSTYGAIAQEIGNPNASRAVGTAIGSNPVAFLIPCHRVIQASGIIGGYMWNPTRKQAIIGWENAQAEIKN